MIEFSWDVVPSLSNYLVPSLSNYLVSSLDSCAHESFIETGLTAITNERH